MVSETTLSLYIIVVFGIILVLTIAMLPYMTYKHGYFVLVPLAHALVVNTTTTIPVPLSINVGGGESGSGKTASVVQDPGTLTGVVGLAAATLYRWRQGQKRETIGAQTTAQVANSLKNTDQGIADTMKIIHQVIGQIPGIPEEAKALLANDAKTWNKDNEAYYDKTSPNPNALSSDPIVRQQAKTQDITVKTED